MSKKGLFKLAAYKNLFTKLLQLAEWDLQAGIVTIDEGLFNELKPFLIHYSEGRLLGINITLEDDSIVIRSQGKDSGVAFKARHIMKIKSFILSREKNYLEFSVEEAIQGKNLKDRILLSTVKSVMHTNEQSSFISKILKEVPGINQVGNSYIANLDDIPEAKKLAELCLLGFSLKDLGVISLNKIASQKIVFNVNLSQNFLNLIDNLLPEI